MTVFKAARLLTIGNELTSVKRRRRARFAKFAADNWIPRALNTDTSEASVRIRSLSFLLILGCRIIRALVNRKSAGGVVRDVARGRFTSVSIYRREFMVACTPAKKSRGGCGGETGKKEKERDLWYRKTRLLVTRRLDRRGARLLCAKISLFYCEFSLPFRYVRRARKNGEQPHASTPHVSTPHPFFTCGRIYLWAVRQGWDLRRHRLSYVSIRIREYDNRDMATNNETQPGAGCICPARALVPEEKPLTLWCLSNALEISRGKIKDTAPRGTSRLLTRRSSKTAARYTMAE